MNIYDIIVKAYYVIVVVMISILAFLFWPKVYYPIIEFIGCKVSKKYANNLRNKNLVLKNILDTEKQKYTNMSYDDLLKIKYPLHYGIKKDNTEYLFEIGLLENNMQCLHITIMISDDRKRTFRIPLSDSFLVYSDGTVDA